jgi:hypothetical protein
MRALLVLCATLVATPVLAGPPWISIEYPVNPFDARARGAILLVHAWHHGSEADDTPVMGTAEGRVNRQRKSIPLEFTRTSRPGVFALRNQWGTTGEWTLVISVGSAHQPPAEAAQALIRVSGDRIRSVEVPTRQANGYSFPRPITNEEIEASLEH